MPDDTSTPITATDIEASRKGAEKLLAWSGTALASFPRFPVISRGSPPRAKEPLMKSPFPGMDPYIETPQLWKDFHDNLIVEVQRAIDRSLPRGYIAHIGSRSYIVLAESEEKKERYFEPEHQGHAPRGKRKPARGNGGTATAVEEVESVSLRAFIEEDFEESFIDIYELEETKDRLVTSIEVLSPSNKVRGSKGWLKYLRKRQTLLLGKANLVEIDLLRGGTRMPMLDPLPASPYYLLVAREEKAPYCRVWPPPSTGRCRSSPSR